MVKHMVDQNGVHHIELGDAEWRIVNQAMREWVDLLDSERSRFFERESDSDKAWQEYSLALALLTRLKLGGE